MPNNPAKYGPLAGKAIAGAEGQNRLYAFGTDGSVNFYPLSVAIEDIDMINANENFYGVNYGSGRLLGAEASQFTSLVGDILLTQEFASGSALFTLRWDGSSLVTTPLGLTPQPVPSQRLIQAAPTPFRPFCPGPTTTQPLPAPGERLFVSRTHNSGGHHRVCAGQNTLPKNTRHMVGPARSSGASTTPRRVESRHFRTRDPGVPGGTNPT